MRGDGPVRPNSLGRYNSSDLERDPRYKQVLEEVSFQYIKENPDSLKHLADQGLKPEVAASGYLLREDGSESNTLSSYVVGGDKDWPIVLGRVREKLAGSSQ